MQPKLRAASYDAQGRWPRDRPARDGARALGLGGRGRLAPCGPPTGAGDISQAVGSFRKKQKKVPPPTPARPGEHGVRTPGAPCPAAQAPSTSRHFEHALDIGLGESYDSRERGEGHTLRGRSRSRDQTGRGSVPGRVWPPRSPRQREGPGRAGARRGRRQEDPQGGGCSVDFQPSGHGPHACTPAILRAAGVQRSKWSVTWGGGRRAAVPVRGRGRQGGRGLLPSSSLKQVWLRWPRPRAVPSWDAGRIRICLLCFLGWCFF